MDGIRVRGGRPLSGAVRVGGAKNSVLKLIAATLLAEGTYELTNVPSIVDVGIMGDLVAAMGARVEHLDGGARLRLHTPAEIVPEAPYELVERIRASIVVLGPLLARCGRARVCLPGGDDFGVRPIDMHIAGLEALGAEFTFTDGVLDARADVLVGNHITLDFPSVGATENIVMAAVGAKGTTVLENAAREPEIADLCAFLVAMGAQIDGAGSATIVVHGVPHEDLHATSHRVVPDRVEAATFLAAVAVAGGELHVLEARAAHMEMPLRKLTDMGLAVTDTGEGLWAQAPGRLRSVDVATLPYPGVATDYKPLMTAILTVADGVGIEELLRLGADIRTDNHHAVVRGVPRLTGAAVKAHDIRAGAAMVVAALAADGETVIDGVHHIDRGYSDLVGQLAAVGADIERIA
jgi:UDP-N-acetylglucosamine 1-carboxyvinyltransferase